MSELHTDPPPVVGQSEFVLHEMDVSTSQYPHVIGVGPGAGCGAGCGAGVVPSEIHLP